MLTLEPSKLGSNASANRAEALNQGCYCTTLDRDRLAQAFDCEVAIQGFARQLSESHPTLFSNTAVFVPSTALDAMKRIIDAIEAAARMPGFQTTALAAALLLYLWLPNEQKTVLFRNVLFCISQLHCCEGLVARHAQ